MNTEQLDAFITIIVSLCITVGFIAIIMWFYNWGVDLRDSSERNHEIKAQSCYIEYYPNSEVKIRYCGE